MAHPMITTIEMASHNAAYKRCSGAAVAFTRAMVNLRQMKPDSITQRSVEPEHVKKLRRSMEEEGVRKGEDLHAYIDIMDPRWGDRSKEDVCSLIQKMDDANSVKGDGTVIMSVLPEDIPLRITTGVHRLYAFCSYLVDHWDEIEGEKPPLDSPPEDCPFAVGLRKTPAEILAQENACWIVTLEYIPNLNDPNARKALFDFTVDLNKLELIMPDSPIRIATLTSLGSNRTPKKAYKWLADTPEVPVILNRLSKYPFLHTEKLIPERRFEDMGYVRQRSLCILALLETVGHLDHICEVLSLDPSAFVVNQMWKRVTGTPMAVIKKKDLNPFLVTHMNFVHAKAWEVTLVRRWGTLPFTGEANWADGSDWWTLATTFDPNGWFFSKLNLALAFLYWTTHFIYCDNIGANEAGRKGTDYLLVLIEYLAKDTRTEMLQSTILPCIWRYTTQAMSEGVTATKLQAFSIKRIKDAQDAIDVYFDRVYYPKVSEDDVVFSKYLGFLVNRNDGFVGRYSGWVIGGSLQRSLLNESEGGEDDEQSTPRARVGRSKAQKGANKPLADPKGKGKARKGALDDDEEQSPPPPPSASKSATLKIPLADRKGKGKVTRRPDTLTHAPVKTSKRGMEGSSNPELPSSSSARRKEQKPSGVEEKEKETQHEEDIVEALLGGQPGGEGAEVIDEEHISGKETGLDVTTPTKYWKGFRKVLEDMEETEYPSIEEWYKKALEAVTHHKDQLLSMSKD